MRSSDSSRNLFLDVLFLALLGFVMVTVLLLFHVNPPQAGEDRPPGNVVIQLTWPAGCAADVDLWVMGPDMQPVGYSNRESELFNLLRDDLGHHSDLTGINHEISYSRGILAGEYQANVHLYADKGCSPPIPVVVAASVRRTEKTRPITTTTVHLTHLNHEITAFRFKLTDEGRLRAGSIHALPRALRPGL